jgi:hypothetical protein
MAINSGRLVVLPINTVDESGNLILDYQSPKAEGQIAVWQQNVGDPAAQAYVAVFISGALQWVRVIHTLGLQNSNTGTPWDPLASFYNPLAS